MFSATSDVRRRPDMETRTLERSFSQSSSSGTSPGADTFNGPSVSLTT